MQILTPIWHEKLETARRVRQRISSVMKWAVAMQYRPDNPAGDALGQAPGRHRAVPHEEVAGAVKAVRASRAGDPVEPAGWRVPACRRTFQIRRADRYMPPLGAAGLC